MQLFNPAHFGGNLLYLDLDVVVFNSLDWVTASNPDYFGPYEISDIYSIPVVP
jgi:hypothetical protein